MTACEATRYLLAKMVSQEIYDASRIYYSQDFLTMTESQLFEEDFEVWQMGSVDSRRF